MATKKVDFSTSPEKVFAGDPPKETAKESVQQSPPDEIELATIAAVKPLPVNPVELFTLRLGGTDHICAIGHYPDGKCVGASGDKVVHADDEHLCREALAAAILKG